MRLSLVGLNLLALAVLLGAAWLNFNAAQQFAPLPEAGRRALFWVFGLGAAALLVAVAQFSRKRRMHPWGAITPMVIGFLLLAGGFGWLILNAAVPR